MFPFPKNVEGWKNFPFFIQNSTPSIYFYESKLWSKRGIQLHGIKLLTTSDQLWPEVWLPSIIVWPFGSFHCYCHCYGKKPLQQIEQQQKKRGEVNQINQKAKTFQNTHKKNPGNFYKKTRDRKKHGGLCLYKGLLLYYMHVGHPFDIIAALGVVGITCMRSWSLSTLNKGNMSCSYIFQQWQQRKKNEPNPIFYGSKNPILPPPLLFA